MSNIVDKLCLILQNKKIKYIRKSNNQILIIHPFLNYSLIIQVDTTNEFPYKVLLIDDKNSSSSCSYYCNDGFVYDKYLYYFSQKSVIKSIKKFLKRNTFTLIIDNNL